MVHCDQHQCSVVPVQIELCESLVCERTRHDKRRVAYRASKIQQSARCQYNHTMTIREDPAIHLWFDVVALDSSEALQSSHVNLIVKTASVAIPSGTGNQPQRGNCHRRWGYPAASVVCLGAIGSKLLIVRVGNQ